MNKTCGHCGAFLREGDAVCPVCGTVYGQASQNLCPSCRAAVPPNSTFCPSCGTSLTDLTVRIAPGQENRNRNWPYPGRDRSRVPGAPGTVPGSGSSFADYHLPKKPNPGSFIPAAPKQEQTEPEPNLPQRWPLYLPLLLTAALILYLIPSFITRFLFAGPRDLVEWGLTLILTLIGIFLFFLPTRRLPVISSGVYTAMLLVSVVSFFLSLIQGEALSAVSYILVLLIVGRMVLHLLSSLSQKNSALFTWIHLGLTGLYLVIWIILRIPSFVSAAGRPVFVVILLRVLSIVLIYVVYSLSLLVLHVFPNRQKGAA